MLISYPYEIFFTEKRVCTFSLWLYACKYSWKSPPTYRTHVHYLAPYCPRLFAVLCPKSQHARASLFIDSNVTEKFRFDITMQYTYTFPFAIFSHSYFKLFPPKSVHTQSFVMWLTLNTFTSSFTTAAFSLLNGKNNNLRFAYFSLKNTLTWLIS